VPPITAYCPTGYIQGGGAPVAVVAACGRIHHTPGYCPGDRPYYTPGAVPGGIGIAQWVVQHIAVSVELLGVVWPVGVSAAREEAFL
jgi:hypothetical protein